MSPGKTADCLEKIIYPLSRVVNGVGMCFLPVMMILTVADVFLRYLLGLPIRGAYELTQYMLVIVVFFGVAYTATQKGHVSIELVVERLPPRVQAVIATIINFIGMCIFVLIAWAAVLEVKLRLVTHARSIILGVPTFPFSLVVVLGCVILSLVLLVDFLSYLTKGLRG